MPGSCNAFGNPSTSRKIIALRIADGSRRRASSPAASMFCGFAAGAPSAFPAASSASGVSGTHGVNGFNVTGSTGATCLVAGAAAACAAGTPAGCAARIGGGCCRGALIAGGTRRNCPGIVTSGLGGVTGCSGPACAAGRGFTAGGGAEPGGSPTASMKRRSLSSSLSVRCGVCDAGVRGC